MLDQRDEADLHSQRLSLQACAVQRQAEVLRYLLVQSDDFGIGPNVRGLREQLETLADCVVLNATALKAMADGKTHREAMTAALEKGE